MKIALAKTLAQIRSSTVFTPSASANAWKSNWGFFIDYSPNRPSRQICTSASLMTASNDSGRIIEYSPDLPAAVHEDCPFKNPFMDVGRMFPFIKKSREDRVVVWVDLPGISKENLKMWTKSHCVYLQAEEDVSDELVDGGARKYNGSIFFPEGRCNMDKIKAVMKNGVLKLVVPILRCEETRDDGGADPEV